MTTFSAVVTTGIYCRPGCGAKPRAENVRTFELAAAAEAAGFRACLRCRPYRITGAVPWDGPELVCRAVQMIIAGALDEGTETDLGRRLGLSPRHLRRLFNEHLGLTPDQLARSRRAHFARRLLDDSDLSVADIAFASGFGSLRQFNRTMREVFRASPQQLRLRRRRTDRLAADGGLTHRLPFVPPYDWNLMLAFLKARAIPGIETVDGDTYRRTITLDGDPGMLEIRPSGNDYLLLRAHLPYWEGLIHVVERVARMLCLDVDMTTAIDHLAPDPVIGPMIAARPGLRIPGVWGPFEVGVHCVLRQFHDEAETREAMGRIVQAHGPVVPGLSHGLTHAFPAPGVLAAAGDVPEAVRAFALAVAQRQIVLDGSVELNRLVASVTAVPGMRTATAHHLAMRLGERDASPLTDLDRWRPWRSLAAMHLLTDAAAP